MSLPGSALLNTVATGGTLVGPGDSALAVGEALAKQNIPYSASPNPPQSFDCSSFVEWCYNKGPGIEISRSTWTQWNSPNLTTICDVQAQQISGGGFGPTSVTNQPPTVINVSDLQDGDLIYYFADNNTGSKAHVIMYAGGGQGVQAPYTNQVVGYTTIAVDSAGNLAGINDPLRGVRRATGGGSSSGASGTGSGSGSGNNPSTPPNNVALTQPQQADLIKKMKAASDPPNNLPFSALFQGQASHGTRGSLYVPQVPGLVPTLNPATKLVRGGMGELTIQRFKCYFMMNPQTISVDMGIDTSQLSPFLQNADYFQSGGNAITQETISFTIYFNRMYEVWQGGVKGPDGGPGPSDVGVRWDIRALERLMGIFDAIKSNGGAVGLGTYGWGDYPPSQLPMQIVFGTDNSIQFQGLMASFDYTFTIFDSNMVPVEAYADISVMRVYNQTQTTPDIVSSLYAQTLATGPQNLPPTQSQLFNQPYTQ